MIPPPICLEQPCGGVLHLPPSEAVAHKAILAEDSISLLELAAGACTDIHTERAIRLAINNLHQLLALEAHLHTSNSKC